MSVMRTTVALHGAEHELAVLTLPDRRDRTPRRKQFVLVRAVEQALFHVQADGRSTGAFANHLSRCTMRDAVLVAEKRCVEAGTLTDDEVKLALDEMKRLVDAEAKGRVRKASLVPVTVCCASLTEFGRTDATSALLKAMNKLPKKWQMEIEHEANLANGQLDLVLEEELHDIEEDGCDEHAEVTLLHELVADFEPYAEVEEDNLKVAKLQTLSPALKKELAEWRAFRSSPLNRLRVGTKVAEMTHESEAATVLRFFGWLKEKRAVAEPTLRVFRQPDIGAIVEEYGVFLRARELMWSSIANYLAALINAAQYATVGMAEPPPLDELANLRSQAEKMAAEDRLYRKKSPNWIDWPDVQRTRVAVIQAYNQAPPDQKAGLLKDVLVIMLHSVTPPDRVGVIRKLRWNLSLKKEQGSFLIDTTQQRHKTSKFVRGADALHTASYAPLLTKPVFFACSTDQRRRRSRSSSSRGCNCSSTRSNSSTTRKSSRTFGRWQATLHGARPALSGARR